MNSVILAIDVPQPPHDPVILRVLDEMKRHFNVGSTSYIDFSSGRQVGTLWLPTWGTWIGDDEPTLSDESIAHLHVAFDAWRSRFPRIDISWNEYAEDGLTGVVVYVQRQARNASQARNVGETKQASTSRKWKELDLSSKVVGRPDQPDPATTGYAVVLCKSRYGDWGSIRLSTKTLTIEAQSLERAVEQARALLVVDDKYKTLRLEGGDSIGWSLEIDTRLYAPRQPTVVTNRISP